MVNSDHTVLVAKFGWEQLLRFVAAKELGVNTVGSFTRAVSTGCCGIMTGRGAVMSRCV